MFLSQIHPRATTTKCCSAESLRKLAGGLDCLPNPELLHFLLQRALCAQSLWRQPAYMYLWIHWVTLLPASSFSFHAFTSHAAGQWEGARLPSSHGGSWCSISVSITSRDDSPWEVSPNPKSCLLSRTDLKDTRAPIKTKLRGKESRKQKNPFPISRALNPGTMYLCIKQFARWLCKWNLCKSWNKINN